MLKEKETVIRRFLMLLDGVVILLAYLLAFFIRKEANPGSQAGFWPLVWRPSLEFDLSLSEHLVFIFIGLTLWCLMLNFSGMYRRIRTRSFPDILWGVFKSALLAFLGSSSLLFLFKVHYMSRLFFGLFFGLSLGFVLAEKTILFWSMRYFRQQGINSRRLLVVGTGRRAADFISRVNNHPEWGCQILGVIDDDPQRGIQHVNGMKVIGTLGDISRIFHSDAVDAVVFIVPRSRLSALEEAIRDCETEGVVVMIAVDLFDMQLAKSSVTELDGLPLLHFQTTVGREWQLFIKRIIDIVVSGLGLVILSPFLLVISILIKLTSRGPVFFSQERMGLHGRIFQLFKFRTMRKGAHEILSNVSDLREMDTPEFRKKKMQWITPLGRVMRKLSIDEIPQLINVFFGQMSLVGPRPTVHDEVAKYQTWQRRRLSVRPGITCLWQVNGRNKIGFEEWMKLDLEYLDHWSLLLDFKILIKTIPIVLFGVGAY